MNNILATILTFAVALAFLRLMDFFASRGWIDPRLSRKMIHIGTGPIFVLCWLMFDESALTFHTKLQNVIHFIIVSL